VGAPRLFVAAGPYRWVRNPIYIAAPLIVSGEAWLFLSAALLLYAGVLAVAFDLLVIGYEEPRLRARFGEQYEAYRRTVSCWIPVHRLRELTVLADRSQLRLPTTGVSSRAPSYIDHPHLHGRRSARA
jgi:Phospholipid methyltransferase